MKTRAFSAFPKEGLQFLRNLKRNNKREWFLDHKTIYEQYVKQPISDLIEALGAEFQRFAPEMVSTSKVSAYRIHRDTRFSKDKSPYKTHVAAVFPNSRLGKHEGAGFYLHIAPTELLIGGGLYMPIPEDLNAVRRAIADNPAKFLKVIRETRFKKLFGQVTGDQLSRIPRGFSSDNPAADFLRHKNFLAARTFPSEVATSRQFYRTVVETFKGMVPFVRFLNDPILSARRIRERQKAFLS
jgi:uncharacterized protein (TIGR02453 family)